MSWIIPDGYSGQPAAYMAMALFAFFLTALSKGGFGGLGSLGIPLMMVVVDQHLSNFVLGLWLPLLVLADVCTIRSFPTEWSLRPILLLAPWVLAGVLVGWQLLSVIDGRVVKLLVGGVAVFFALLEWSRGGLMRLLAARRQDHAWRPAWWSAAPFGLAVGIATMIAHSAGVITAIYLLAQRLPPSVFAGTSGRFYLVVNTLKIPFYLQLHVITWETVYKGLWLVPLVPLGVWAGAWLNRRLSAETFNRVVYILLFGGGVYLLYQNRG